MNICDYMKKNNIDTVRYADGEAFFIDWKKHIQKSKNRFYFSLISAFVILCVIGFSINNIRESEHTPTISLIPSSLYATESKMNTISVPSGIVKANPFLPYRNIEGVEQLSDVPTFDLVAPPEVLDEGSDAVRIMDTIVSGILYDAFSPSAILNIEGNDYLVKKGDVVNNYKVLDIKKDSVTVKLGSNTFKAGIGEILTEGTVNHNDVSNLNKKFGGERR